MKLVGFQVPYWNEIRSLVCDAHLVFPGYLCQGWDIAICEDGPKILEVNEVGDIDLSQHAYRRGFLDDDFLILMRGRGLERLLSRTAGHWQRGKKNGRLGKRKRHWPWW